MKHEDRLEHLGNQLDSLIERFRLEYDVTFAELISVLEMKKFFLCMEVSDEVDDDDDDDADDV